jgi:hypothetical protein
MTQQSTHNPDGGTLADFLKEEGLYEEVMLGATKKVISCLACVGVYNRDASQRFI